MLRLPTNSIRVVLGLIGLVGLYTGPWFLTPIAIILLALRYRAWEGLILGLCMDLLWHPAGAFFQPFPLYTFGAIIIVWVLEPLRRQLLAAS